jgi:hypothetical protein
VRGVQRPVKDGIGAQVVKVERAPMRHPREVSRSGVQTRLVGGGLGAVLQQADDRPSASDSLAGKLTISVLLIISTFLSFWVKRRESKQSDRLRRSVDQLKQVSPPTDGRWP